jgi:ketosteroid isomerase-like protein
VDAFYAAARQGDVEGLVAVLHPDVALRSDAGPGHRTVLRGARDVAGQTALAARLAPLVRPVLVHGTAGGAVVAGGRVATVMAFTVVGGKIATVEVLQDPGVLAGLTVSGPS